MKKPLPILLWLAVALAGGFVEAYREQIAAFVCDLAGENPALRKLQSGAELTPDELESIAPLLNGPDRVVTEDRLRQVCDQPDASLADFPRHSLRQAVLSRARIASLAQLHQAPFNCIGDPEWLFAPAELDEILGLAQSLAA